MSIETNHHLGRKYMMRSMRCVFTALLLLCCAVQAQQAEQREVTSDKLEDEAALIATLQSDAGFVEKQMACRALKIVGTAASVPVLAALLPDETLSHQARYALESMQAPEAAQALRDAVATTSGAPQVGIVISLGARHDAEAEDEIAPLLQSGDPVLIRAAAGALGRIATPEAVEALEAAAGSAGEAVKPYVAEGLLAAGQRLTEQRKNGEAAAIYQALLDESWPEFVRLGAFRGLALAQPEQAPDQILTALGGSDEAFRGLAAQLVAEIPGDFTASEYAAAMDPLNAAGQAAFLRGLAGRKDPEGRLAAIAGLDNADPAVKLAAVQALAVLGTQEDVATLSGLMTGEDESLSKAARASLKNLSGAEVDAAIVARLQEASAEEQAQLLQLLSDRMSPETVTVAVAHLDAEAAPVRIAALEALAQQGTGAEAEAIVAALKGAEDAAERNAAGRALGSISMHHGEAVLPVLLEGMKDAKVDAKLAMVRTLDRIGSTEALNATVALLEDTEPRISNEAARVLSNWPSAEAAPHLLKLAEGESSALKDLGLRGYVRLARNEQDLAKRVEMLNTAMAQAKTPQEKFIVLAAWSTVPTGQALDTLQPFLDDPSVQNEAASAMIDVAAALGKQQDPAAKTKAREALQAVIDKVQNEGTRARAQSVLEGIPA